MPDTRVHRFELRLNDRELATLTRVRHILRAESTSEAVRRALEAVEVQHIPSRLPGLAEAAAIAKELR